MTSRRRSLSKGDEARQAAPPADHDDSGIALDDAHEQHTPKQEATLHVRKHGFSKGAKELAVGPPKDPLIRLRVGSKLYTAHHSVLANGSSAFFADLLSSSSPCEITPPISAVDGISLAFGNLLYFLHMDEYQPTTTLLEAALVYTAAHDTGTPALQILAVDDFKEKLKKIGGNWGFHNEVAEAVEVVFGAYCACSEEVYEEIVRCLDVEGWLGAVLKVRGVREVMAGHPGLCMVVIDYLAEGGGGK